MSKSNNSQEPYQRLHKWLLRLTFVCVIGLVFENSVIIPYSFLHFGWPDLTLQEIGDELYRISYWNEDIESQWPYPFFKAPQSDNWVDRTDVFGDVVPPAPPYQVPGFREVIAIKEERMERQRLEKEYGRKKDAPEKPIGYGLEYGYDQRKYINK